MDTITLGFIFYLIIILYIGLYASKQTKNLKDFALGGHKLGPTVIAFSERASGESAWLLLGLPGAALILGLLEIWTVLGCLSGIFLSWLVIAYPLRKSVEKNKILTLPDFFENKINDKSGMIRVLSSLIIIFFFTFYVAAQFSGAGKVLNATFGLTHFQGMIIGSLIIIFYTLLGGFLAVAWTDVIQGIIMIGTLVILPIVGWFELVESGSQLNLDWSKLYGNKTGFAAVSAAIGGLSWGLGYIGQPHLIARYMAINKTKNIKISRRIAFIWAVPAFFGALLIGLIGLGLIDNGLLKFNGNILTSINSLDDPEKLMPIMAKNLLPAWLAGIFISGAIAAMMSTADSQLLVSTTILTKKMNEKIIHKPNTDKNQLMVGRLLILLIGIIAFKLALDSKELVFGMVSFAWGGLGAAFGPALVLSLWWKNISRLGVIFGMIFGTLFTIWPIAPDVITPRLTAFIISTIAVIGFSYFENSLDN